MTVIYSRNDGERRQSASTGSMAGVLVVCAPVLDDAAGGAMGEHRLWQGRQAAVKDAGCSGRGCCQQGRRTV